LKNKELNQDDKIQLYTNVLGKYKKFEEKVYPNENSMPDNQENFQTPTKQKLFPKKGSSQEKNRQACIIVHGFR
jgi:hypothetical protein